MERRWGGRPRVTTRWWLAALIMLIALPMGIATARQAVFDKQSPATGHAQVVTQGIAKLPKGDVVWRVVERTAQPRVDAKAGRRVLGFVLASEEPVLLTNVTANGNEDVARLAPGESLLVKSGTRQIRASLSDQPVTYLAVELVAATDAQNVGSGGTLLFTSQPFTAPSGERDIDLVRNVLEMGEQATIPDTGESVAILATDGAVDVLPSGGRGKTLQAGESAIFAPGELQVEAVSSTAQGGAVRAQVAALTSSLQSSGSGNAAYVVAVIGPEIPPAPAKPTATSTPVPTAVPTQAPAPTGSIAVTVYNCPPGMTVENLSGDICEPSGDGYDFALSGPAGDLTLADAANLDGAWQWQVIPLGQYLLSETALPSGYESYFIPGSAAVGGSPDTGYSVAIDESAPDISLTVYNLQPAPQMGSITLDLYLCPSNSTPDDFDPASCSLATGGYELSLLRTSTNEPYGMADGVDNGGSVSWSKLPLDTYIATVDALPEGWDRYLGPDGAVHGVGEGVPIQIGGSSAPDAWYALYAFGTRID